MVSKRQKIVAIVFIVLLVVTGFVYLTLPAPETASQAMIIRPNEIGQEWQGGATNVPFSIPGETSNSRWEYYLQNSTIGTTAGFEVTILNFNSTVSSLHAFEQDNSSYYAERTGINYSSAAVGDRAFYVNEAGEMPRYEFVRGTVLCWVKWVQYDSSFDAWWADILLNIVHIQLNNIDQHLGS
jgi:hypothetical protein